MFTEAPLRSWGVTPSAIFLGVFAYAASRKFLMFNIFIRLSIELEERRFESKVHLQWQNTNW
jgi:hypothetical protein